MSSDNYLLVRRAGDRYALTDESASAAEPPDSDDPVDVALWAIDATTPIDDPRVTWYPTLDDATSAASLEYAEYGYQVVDGDHSDDTRAARLANAATVIASSLDDPDCDGDPYTVEMLSNEFAHQSVVLNLAGGLTVRIFGGTSEQAHQLRRWLEATSPSAVAAALRHAD